MRSLRAACVIMALALASAAPAGCTDGAGMNLGRMVEDILPPSPSEVARDAFHLYEPDRRRRAVNMIATAPWGGEPVYVRTYRLLLEDPDPSVRAASIRALARHGHPDDVPAIAAELDHSASFVRWEAAMALERLHHPAAVPPLLQRLRDDDDVDVRLAAARALGQYPEQRVFEGLVGALTDADYSVVRQAERSLHMLTGERLGDRGSEWLAWADDQGQPFGEQRAYYYTEFIRPAGMLDYLQFWRRHPRAEPTQPLGLEGTQRVDVAPPQEHDPDADADDLPPGADELPDLE